MSIFSEDELRCKCGCGEYKFDDEALSKLNDIRRDFGGPLIITSGYRCDNHPVEAKKAISRKGKYTGQYGAHNEGKAVDIAVSHGDAHKLLKIALKHGVQRVGINQKGANRFIHLDWSTRLPSPTVWSY